MDPSVPTTGESSDRREHTEFTYMVTIKCNHNRYTPLQELLKVYYKLVKKIDHCEWHTKYAIELDTLGRLHLHGLFTRTKKINPASYRKPGWTIHFQPIDDYYAGRNYINKEAQNTFEHEQREIESYYHYNYGFTNEDNHAEEP